MNDTFRFGVLLISLLALLTSCSSANVVRGTVHKLEYVEIDGRLSKSKTVVIAPIDGAKVEFIFPGKNGPIEIFSTTTNSTGNFHIEYNGPALNLNNYFLVSKKGFNSRKIILSRSRRGKLIKKCKASDEFYCIVLDVTLVK